jgi:hypothetical protein
MSNNSEFANFTNRLARVRANIEEIQELNEKVAKNDKLQKKEIDHKQKIARDKETQNIYNELKKIFKKQLEELEDLKFSVENSNLEQIDKDGLLTNIQSAYVNLDTKLKDSHQIYSEYRKNFKEVLVRQFMNVDMEHTNKEEVERLVDENPDVDL